MPITLSVREPSSGPYDNNPRRSPKTFKGRQFQDPGSGETIELFTVIVLSTAIDRTTAVLRQWMKDGSLPRPIFSIEGTRRGGHREVYKHWFSASQVVNVHRIFMHRYGGRKYLDSNRFEIRKFLSDITAVWYEGDVVVGEDGKLPQEKANG